MSASNGAFDVDAFLADYTPRTRIVALYRRGDLADRLTAIDEELASLATARRDPEAEVQALVDEAEQVRVDLEASKVEVKVTACGTERWYELLEQHPPTDEDRKLDPNAAYGREFEHHALAACLGVSVDDVKRLRAQLRPGDFQALFTAMTEVCAGEVPKASALATAIASYSGPPSTNRKQRRSRGASGAGADAGQSRNTTTRKAS